MVPYLQKSPLSFSLLLTDVIEIRYVKSIPHPLLVLTHAAFLQVLHNNYLMIRIDSYESDDTCSDWFCYHATSPCIFPAGFCEMHNIPLTPPRGYEGQFSWFTYLKKTQATAAPPSLFNRVKNWGLCTSIV